MEVLNYTGKEIGIISKSGYPITVLFPWGNAKCIFETNLKVETDNLIPIYDKGFKKVVGLPAPDPNKETYYIVNNEVAQWQNRVRRDLLIPTEPITHQGATFYKKLILAF